MLDKYLDKIVYNYPLARFRESGYTKDFQNFATDTTLWDRTLIALIMSEYRRYLFADLKLNMKPVILLKSQKIIESEDFYQEFLRHISELRAEEISTLKNTNIPLLTAAIQYFENKDSTLETLKYSIQSSFAEEHIIVINRKSDGNKENQLLVNSLEDRDNPIRLIFAVDMLNEGWDVLNLFDIVRLYDTRQSLSGGKIGRYTNKEAQLVGRGARYCPFIYNDPERKYQRKFDDDLDNPYRILETMFFHSRNDSRYIAELKQALIATGLQARNQVTREYRLKQEFKESDFYRQAVVYTNRRIPRGRAELKSIEPSLRTKIYRYRQRSASGTIVNLFGGALPQVTINRTTTIPFKKIDYHILSGAATFFPELRFDVIHEKYPNVKSLREFLTSEEYLGNSVLEITQTQDTLSGRDLFEACKKAMKTIAMHVTSLKQEFVGSREFLPRPLKSVLRDKKISLSSIEDNGGYGDSQNNCLNDNYQLYVVSEPWYVFEDNYGTGEEKLFIKHFKSIIEPQLKAKNLEYYVIRNERVPELAIYSFEAGERFEPDFLLFIRNREDNERKTWQTYIEPKGSHLLLQDKWKEDFLKQIEDQYVINDLLGKDYTIIGLPFFNQEERIAEFDKAIEQLITQL